ncbi:MAG: arsenate reductase (glutaredoxin) [Crocinitomicaceae bacterium]
MKIWHNNRCSKSRCAVEFLNDKNIDFETVYYLDNPPTKDELKEVLKMLGIKAETLVRKNEPIFKEKFKGQHLTEAAWIKAMVDHPKLIERPIIINNGKAVVGRPAENILDII